MKAVGRQVGYWYGGPEPPSEWLVDRIQEQESRARELYALQDGRERGEWTVAVDRLREKLPLVAAGPEPLQPRSAAAALRRVVRRVVRDPDDAVGLLLEVGDPIGPPELLRQWLGQDPRRRDDPGAFLAQAWAPAPGSLLARLLSNPVGAAEFLAAWLFPPAGGPLRILCHGTLHAAIVSRLNTTRVAAYQCPGEIHLFDSVLQHLEACQERADLELEGNPLTLLETLLLHEAVEVVAADRDSLAPVAAHVVATTTERVWGRGEGLALAINTYFDEMQGERGAAGSGEEDEAAAGPARVLVVDDTSMARRVITGVVRSLGHTAFEAASAAEAVAQAYQHEPDLIILELSLPDGDGLTCLAHIRERKELADTPAIVVTARTEGQAVRDAAYMGIVDYLLKPVKVDQLSRRIARCLQAPE